MIMSGDVKKKFRTQLKNHGIFIKQDLHAIFSALSKYSLYH